jgi:hypothetical protein
MRVSRGFYACVKRQLEWHKIKPRKEYEGYWHFIQTYYKSTVLLQDFLLDRFRTLLKQGLAKNNLGKFAVSEERLSVFVFYLCTKNRKYLHRIMHTLVPHLDPVSRRHFRRTWLRTEQYLLRQKGRPIKGREKIQTSTMNKVVDKSVSSVSNDSISNCPLVAEETVVVNLTAANLEKHNKRKSSSRPTHSPKRFKPDLTNLKDDLSASEVGSDEVPVEERSVDSQSAGSLKDFVVDDNDEEPESESYDEESLSDRETEDSQSFHSSALTDSESINNE